MEQKFKLECEVCLVEEISPISGIKDFGCCQPNFRIDHGVTVSVDSNGSDWTGYLGGIILSDDGWESDVDESENEDIKNNGE